MVRIPSVPRPSAHPAAGERGDVLQGREARQRRVLLDVRRERQVERARRQACVALLVAVDQPGCRGRRCGLADLREGRRARGMKGRGVH